MSQELDEVTSYDVLKELENTDFSTSTKIDIDKYYASIENVERDTQLAQSLESEYQVQVLGPKYLTEKCAEDINKDIKSIENLLDIYDVEKDKIKNMSSSEIDKIFGIVKYFNLKLSKSVNGMIFNLTLTRDEYKFIANAFRNSLSYNGNDILMIGDLKNTLNVWEEIDRQLPTSIPSFVVEIDIKNIVVMYQFLSKHEVKGISKSFYTFANIINYIKESNDLFNAFNVIRERVNSKFLVWAGATNAITEAQLNNTEVLS